MPIVSKEIEIQQGLVSIYDSLLDQIQSIKTTLSFSRNRFSQACLKHIESGYLIENEYLDADESHHIKFLEYDIYCHIQEIINDFKDLYGHFPEYKQMYLTLNNIMLEFARQEKYELAAITKLWVDKIKIAIQESN